MTVTLGRNVDFIGAPRQLFINGQWTDAASGKTFETPNPATGDTLARVAEGDAEDINRAVKAARRAFEEGPWDRMTPSERGRIIWRIGDLILEHADELARLESLDNGKPFAVARASDVPLAADVFHYMAGWATKIEGNTINISVPYMPGANFHSYTLREPLGVVGQIIPWNFPLLMAAWKLGPALATGNCVVLKPAEQTPLTALRLAELIAETGLPDGVVNVVPGFGATAGAALAAHHDVDKVAFTGSTEVGKLIVAAAGASNLKKLSLELGGKSPNIVFDDADSSAIEGAANAIFFNHGQYHVAGSRLYVQRGRFDEVVDGVAEIAKSIKLGPGMERGTQMGPLVSDEQLRRVTGYVQSGIEEGATALSGGGRYGDRGYFVEPTVLTNTRPDMKVVREEIFGPVVVAAPFSDLDEVAAAANDTPYGLGAGIWTKDISKAHALAKKIKAGSVWINCYNVFDAALPFGGYKQSGWGREMGHEALHAYTEVKAVTIQYLDVGIVPGISSGQAQHSDVPTKVVTATSSGGGRVIIGGVTQPEHTREPGREEAPGLHPRTREKEAGPGDRYLVGRVQEEVEAGREFFLSLQVKVTRPEPAAGVSQSHMLIERRGDLLAVLVADPLFSVLTADKVIVPIPQESEGPEKGFTLRARHPGAGWLRVDVHRGTQALTTFRFRVTASETRTESETRSATVGIPQTAAPSELLKILLAGRKERTIQLLVGEMHLKDHPLEIGERALKEQLQKITAQLNEFSDSTARGSITRKREELHGLGKQIYSRLLPGPFVEEFRAHRPSATSLVIQGSSPLPWELMADSDDDTFLAEELRVTRWLNGSQPGAPIRLGNAIFACTDGVDGARDEIEKIGRLLCPGQEPGIIAESVQLHQRMRTGDFGLFHFAGHTKEDKSPETTALDFGNDDDFTLNYMANLPSDTLRASRPIIFLNACGSAGGLGRQTLFEHWAEMFIDRGAGAFIGSLWNIRSDTANMFGIDVYRSIREGAASTLGEAVDFARHTSTGDPSDPTRLAYALYGSDNAQVILNP